MQAQWSIGADIHMAFDHLAKSESHEDMEEAMHRTHRWLDRCVKEHQRLADSTALSQSESEHGGVTLSKGVPRESRAGEEKTAGPAQRKSAGFILYCIYAILSI